MKRLYKFPLENKDQYVLVEIETSEGGRVVRAARASDEATEASASFSDAVSKIQPLVLSLRQILNQDDATKDYTDVAFGVKLTPDGEILVTAGQSDANFLVTVH